MSAEGTGKPERRPVVEGDLLYTPETNRTERARLRAFEAWMRTKHGRTFADYDELWRWSTADLAGFWQAIVDYFDVEFVAQPEAVLRGAMPDAHWFPGATLNFAEHLLRNAPDRDAIVFRAEDGRRETLSGAALRDRVAHARAGLLRLGVGRGDRVAALLPNCPEAVVLLLATASLGAVWSSCSPEFGVKSVLDRFRQIDPKVFVAVSNYRYGGKVFERAADVQEIARGLSARLVLLGESAEPAPAGTLTYAELTAESATLSFDAVPFEHPLWILYSSGTTGLPKAIVHGHGGILLEQLKALALHSDLGPGDRFFWFSTTGWMMWNMLVCGLAVGSSIVLYDGSPAYPNLDTLFRLAEEERVTYFGTSAPYLLTCKKMGLIPREKHELSRLRTLGTTGAPLPAEGFAWVYEAIGSELLLASISGGTDVCTAFVLSCPVLPVRAGEIQCRGLGAKVEAFDEAGRSVTEEVGELVLTAPLPSMPVAFWGDADGSRRRDAYFAVYPSIWRHGDWLKITRHGGCVISGRSDSTLNRGGVRMGTSEFYRVIEALPEISDSLVVDTGSLEDVIGKLWLFVVLAPGVSLDSQLERKIKDVIRRELSPRHTPDAIRAVRVVPRTLNGKKLEVPVKRLLLGAPLDKVASRDTLADPTSLDAFVELAERGVSRRADRSD